jgi:hypothetical protein
MGQPVLDRSARRLDRTITRANESVSVRGLYGSSDYRSSMILRLRQMARRNLDADIPGDVIYDVDPVTFDEFIEVRTGGDRAISADVQVNQLGTRWVSYWPLVNMSEDQTMDGWESTLRSVADRPHTVIAEVESRLEQALTFDFGYQAYGRDVAQTGMYRLLTSPRFLEELRDAHRTRMVSEGFVTPRRLGQVQVTVNDANGQVLITPPATATVRGTYLTADMVNASFDSFERRAMNMPDVREQYRYIDTEPLRAMPIPSVLQEPEEVYNPELWVFDSYVTAYDGQRQGVNEHGLDINGVDPRTPGYETGASCNCEGCMEMRVDAEEDDEEVTVDDDEEEYE